MSLLLYWRRYGIVLGLFVTFILILNSQAAAKETEQETAVYGGPGPVAIFTADPDKKPETAVPPPPNFRANQPNRAAAGGITVTSWVGAWPTQAQAAFQYAVDIWNSLITSSAPIEIRAIWESFSNPAILGGAGANCLYRNVSGASFADTLYAAAEVNAIMGTNVTCPYFDPNTQTTINIPEEISAQFNSSFPSWYYGTDGNPGSGQYDFVSVVLHEIGHGLGFFGLMSYDNGSSSDGAECNNVAGYGCWGLGSGYPGIYERFTTNSGGTLLINAYANPSTALGNALTSGAVYFNGPLATAANDGSPIPLYAPSTWASGSSYSHVAESFNNTPSALMTYSIGPGEVEHSPGPITLAMLRDMDWPIETYPVVSDMPSLLYQTNSGTKQNVLDVYAYVSDENTPDSSLTVSVSDPNNVAAFDGRYIDLDTSGFIGTTTVTVQVTDAMGFKDSNTFNVTLSDQISTIFLPAVLR
ncbi:MAG: hypothetical protein Kow0080_25150 [Candidatus Promineifilaceae bacterium]